jgi:hypothetical protein
VSSYSKETYKKFLKTEVFNKLTKEMMNNTLVNSFMERRVNIFFPQNINKRMDGV